MISPAISRAAVLSPALIGDRWTAHFSDPYYLGTSMTSTPVISKDTIYVVNKDTLYALNTKNGKTRWELRLAARMNSVCDPALDGDRLYIPLSDGILQCVDIRTRDVRWTSETHLPPGAGSAQTLGRLRLYGHCLFAGTWCPSPGSDRSREINSDGVFFCVDTEDGHTLWSYRNEETPSGFYWTQAAVLRDRVFFTSEDGMLISHALDSDTVYETRALADGSMRCGLCPDEQTDTVYTVSKNGQLVRILLSEDGGIRSADSTALLPEKDTAVFTSTPTMYRDTLYIGGSSKGQAVIIVFDTVKQSIRYIAKNSIEGDVKSHPLVLPSGTDPAKCLVVFTINESSGSAYYLSDSTDAVSVKIRPLFIPRKDRQFCLANIVQGPDGTLYYSNDSGTLFALSHTYIRADDPASLKKKKKKLIRRILRCISQYYK